MRRDRAKRLVLVRLASCRSGALGAASPAESPADGSAAWHRLPCRIKRHAASNGICWILDDLGSVFEARSGSARTGPRQGTESPEPFRQCFPYPLSWPIFSNPDPEETLISSNKIHKKHQTIEFNRSSAATTLFPSLVTNLMVQSTI